VGDRSGGHSRAGHGTSEGAIVIDLSRMKGLQVDERGRTAWVETGVTSGECTAGTGERGLVTGLGDTGSVGIGGITLAGGIGFLVRKYGLTVDDLLAADVVSADGELVRASEVQRPRPLLGDPGRRGQLRCRHPSPAAAASDLADRRRRADPAGDANVMPAPPVPFIPEDAHGEPVPIGWRAPPALPPRPRRRR